MLNIDIKGSIEPKCIIIDGKITFDPPVYEQRYHGVYNVLEHGLWQGQIKKVSLNLFKFWESSDLCQAYNYFYFML